MNAPIEGRPSRSMHTRSFGAVVAVRNGAATLRACLDALLDAADRWGGVEVVVVDNGSTDGTWDMLTGHYRGRIRALREPDGTIAEARNRGAAVVTADVIAFVDADCVVAPDYFFAADRALTESGAAATGSRYALPATPDWIERAWNDLHPATGSGCVAYLNGGNLIVRRQAFEQVGGFEARLTTGEDAEFGQRLNAAGLKVYQDPRIRSVHLGNPKDLASFFRQQRWHGLGMFGTARRGLDKPVVMTLAHAALNVAAVVAALLSKASLGARLGVFVAAQMLVPALTVAYRIARGGRGRAILPGLLLYWIYFWARVAALALIIGRSSRADRVSR